MITTYLIYDVFTDEPFGGNPLAVIPDAGGLSPEMFQTIAREFNLSETTFVLPPDDPAHDAKVRIFTPMNELPFAGHPTVGTAIALSELGICGPEMVFELAVGPIPVKVTDGRARFTTRVPLTTGPAPDTAVVAACLGLDASAVRTDRHEPIEASLGTPFVLVELIDSAQLDAASPATDAMRKAAANPTMFAIMAYVRNGARIEARMFAPLGGIVEDPATGSAAAALAAYLGQLDSISQAFTISQGVRMGRPSIIEAEVTVEYGATVEVAIAGHAVKVMEGRLNL